MYGLFASLINNLFYQFSHWGKWFPKADIQIRDGQQCVAHSHVSHYLISLINLPTREEVKAISEISLCGICLKWKSAEHERTSLIQHAWRRGKNWWQRCLPQWNLTWNKWFAELVLILQFNLPCSPSGRGGGASCSFFLGSDLNHGI